MSDDSLQPDNSQSSVKRLVRTLTNISATGLNQARGINKANATGAGIPKQVTDVGVSVTNAQTGSTSTVTVTFRRDPSDINFAGVLVWVKGYQSNPTLVQIAQSTDSPVSIILNNTGESISLVIQAYGNAGNSPLSFAPSYGVTLPKASSGGFSTTSAIIPAAPTVTVPTVWDWLIVPLPGAGATSSGIGGMAAPYPFNPPNNATTAYGGESGCAINSIQSTTEPVSIQYVTRNTAPGHHGFIYNATWQPPLNALRKTRAGVKLSQTTNTRLWISMGTGINTTQQDADNPNISMIGFRYSSGTDSQFMCYCCTSNVAFTALASGVNVDTSFHTFEFDYDPVAGSVTFFIDSKQVGVIKTNVPASTTIVNPLIGISNKSTANAVGFQFYYMKGTANPSYD